jgi:hypothetical protein
LTLLLAEHHIGQICPVVHLGSVSYSVDDPDDAWIEAPLDPPFLELTAALAAAALRGLEMMPADEADPVFPGNGKIRHYLVEMETA